MPAKLFKANLGFSLGSGFSQSNTERFIKQFQVRNSQKRPENLKIIKKPAPSNLNSEKLVFLNSEKVPVIP